MTEKVLKNKKNGMAMLLLFILLYLGALALVILSAVQLDDGRIGFLGLLIPGTASDIAGVVLIAVVYFFNLRKKSDEKGADEV